MNRIFLPGWWSSFLLLLAGASLPLAFAPFNWYGLAIISPSIFLAVLLNSNPRQAFWQGFLYGLAEFGAGVSWVYVSVHDYGNTGWEIAVLLTSLLVAYLALFPAFLGYIFRKLLPQAGNFSYILAFPALWILIDGLRGFMFTGFPWLFLGYSQVGHVLGNYAPLINVYGVSFLVVLSASLLTSSFKSPWAGKILAWLVLAGIWLGGWGLTGYSWTYSDTPSYNLSLIQGNIPQELKWDPQHVRENLQKYVKLTQENLDHNIVIWPEAALIVPLPHSQNIVDYLQKAAVEHHSDLLLGVPIRAENNGYYNSIVAVGEDAQGVYHKRHLLPFGDYLPLASWLRGLVGIFDLPMSSFIQGEAAQPLIKARQLTLASFICYEIAFPELVFQTLRQYPANVLLTISNDTWFGHSIGPAQHLQIAQMRALETGRMLIRSTNNGLTVVVSPEGKIVASLPQFETAVLASTVNGYAGETFAMRWGIWPNFIAAIMLLGIVVFCARYKKI